jgi:L-seryl-tRNA(Ser) seleniumtransferase
MKIPSISELLDSPQLKPWVDRASRNVVVTSVKTFVTKMGNDLQSRAAEMKIPTVGELAERIAEWIARRQASAPHAEINATGVLLPENVTLPIADEALHALQASLRDYVADRTADATATTGQRMIGELARQLTGAEACLVTGTHSGAVLLALAATCTERPAVIARGQVGEIEPGITLPHTARCAGATLRECGIVERVRIEDYDEALQSAGAILVFAPARSSTPGEQPLELLSELAALAKRRDVPLVVDLGLGGIVDPVRYGLAGIPHAADAIRRGADVVIVAGDRLLGGPACGLILGREAAIERLRKHGLFASLAATPLTLLPLSVTLDLHQDLDTADRAIPLLALLSTSADNLKNRADRLAAQLASFPNVASASAVEGTSSLTARPSPGHTISSWEVVVEPRNTTVADLAVQLRSGPLPLSARVAGDRIYLNLRTVLPRHDMAIVDAFEALSRPKTESKEATT